MNNNNKFLNQWSKQFFLQDSLKDLLLKYVNGLGGVLMAFDDLQLQTDNDNNNNKNRNSSSSEGKGWIFNELPHIHYNATVRALVFCPSIGCKVSFFLLLLFFFDPGVGWKRDFFFRSLSQKNVLFLSFYTS